MSLYILSPGQTVEQRLVIVACRLRPVTVSPGGMPDIVVDFKPVDASMVMGYKLK